MNEKRFQAKPLVSIVLPVYNGQKYLRESLDSILAQTVQDWELIAVDDCSTDATPQILADYAARDSRIRIMRNAENQRLPRSLKTLALLRRAARSSPGRVTTTPTIQRRFTRWSPICGASPNM